MNGPGDPIVAAGGIVERDGRIAVIHRPRHDDWSLPKGKVDPGETPERAAVREVAEETGCRATLGEFLETIRYRVGDRPKEVHYWRMSVVGEPSFEPSEEVDRVEWLTPEEALARLTYEGEKRMLQRQQREDGR